MYYYFDGIQAAEVSLSPVSLDRKNSARDLTNVIETAFEAQSLHPDPKNFKFKLDGRLPLKNKQTKQTNKSP